MDLLHVWVFWCSIDNTSFSLLSWNNVRGLNSRARRDAVHTMVEQSGAALIYLQET